MRSQVRANKKSGSSIAFRFTPPQRDAILSVIELMLSLPISECEFQVQVGSRRQELEWTETCLQHLKDAEEIDFSMIEVHLIHSALMAARNQFAREEDFYIRIGFFRDNITGLAQGIVRAIGGLSL
jgi:hypothetical protein